MKDATYIYPYIQLEHYHRPIIPIYLKYHETTIRYPVLVDSGADFSLFPADLAEAFDLSLDAMHPQHIAGVTGDAIAYPTIIQLGVEHDQLFHARVMFSPVLSREQGYGIVGQDGFFDHFIIEFTQQFKTVALTPLPSPYA